MTEIAFDSEWQSLAPAHTHNLVRLHKFYTCIEGRALDNGGAEGLRKKDFRHSRVGGRRRSKVQIQQKRLGHK